GLNGRPLRGFEGGLGVLDRRAVRLGKALQIRQRHRMSFRPRGGRRQRRQRRRGRVELGHLAGALGRRQRLPVGSLQRQHGSACAGQTRWDGEQVRWALFGFAIVFFRGGVFLRLVADGLEAVRRGRLRGGQGRGNRGRG